MWCNVCQCDVATEVAADHRRVSCSTCGQVLGETATSRLDAPADSAPNRAGEARALLDRWAKNHSFDPYGPEKKAATSADPRPSELSSQPVEMEKTGSSVSGSDAEPQSHLDQAEPRQTRSSIRPQSHADAVSQPVGSSLDERPKFRVDAAESYASGADQSRAASGRSSLHASAAELESLTNEILSRVSQISAEREQLREQQAVDRDSRSNPVTHSEPAASSGPMPHSEPAAWQEPQSQSRTAVVDDLDRAESTTSQVHQQTQRGVQGEHVGPPHSQPTHQPEIDRAGPMPSRTHQETARIPEVAESENSAETGLPRSVRREVLHPAPAVDRDPMVNLRSDQPHVGTTRPHVDLNAAETSATKSRGWFSGIGQGLSYLGILLMTGGTAFVISAYFGATTGNAATGWLIATVGQMLLLLGIVTLVSSGMEETASEVSRTVNDRLQEVSRQLEQIGDRIIRVEQGSDSGPRRPHFINRTDTSRQSTSVSAEDEQTR